MQAILRASGATLRYDDNMKSYFFNTVEHDPASNTNRVYQYWYDTPASLRQRYEFAHEQGLLGVGPYVFDNLDPRNAADSRARQDAVEMWSALDSFFDHKRAEEKLARITSWI